MSDTIDLSAYREWLSWPEERRQLYLNSAFCRTCRQNRIQKSASFAPGYVIHKYAYGLIVEGHCSKCGQPIARCCD